MPDMYDKLGEMLNEALESGRIPTENHESHCEDMDCFDVEVSRNDALKKSENPTENPNKSKKTTKSFHCEATGRSNLSDIPTGEVIKLHKYTYNMQFPLHIQKALGTLDIVYPFTQKDISKQYHKLLKQSHPDIQNTIQHSQDVQNNRQITVDEILEAYKILCDFFGIK